MAGACFILPAALLVGLIAWAYVRFGTVPAVEGALYGIKPVVVAVVVQAIWGLSRTALKTRSLVALGLAATAASAAGVHELVILACASVFAALGRVASAHHRRSAGICALLAPAVTSGSTLVAESSTVVSTLAATSPFGLWPLFAVFLKVGTVIFGSGYVLLAFLRADLVERLGWLTERQFLDAVAVGQVTPGPVFTTATFVGYLLGGPAGAAVATVGIFLPAFVFVALSGILLPRLRCSPTAGAVLDGVNAALLALMAVAAWQLGRTALVDPLTIVLAVVSAVLLVHYRLNSAWLVLGGAVAGGVANLP